MPRLAPPRLLMAREGLSTLEGARPRLTPAPGRPVLAVLALSPRCTPALTRPKVEAAPPRLLAPVVARPGACLMACPVACPAEETAVCEPLPRVPVGANRGTAYPRDVLVRPPDRVVGVVPRGPRRSPPRLDAAELAAPVRFGAGVILVMAAVPTARGRSSRSRIAPDSNNRP